MVKLVLGKRGSGKSCRLRDELRSEARVLLYDTLRESTYDAYRRFESFSALCHALVENPPVFRFAYSWAGEVDREDDFARFCEAAYCCKEVAIAVEEVDQFCAPNSLPRYLDRIVSLGRHRGLSFYCASRRPKEIPPLIRAQATEVISFVQTEPADLEWCRAVMGEDADRLPGLRGHQYIRWTEGNPPVYGDPLDKPPESGVDSIQ